MSKLVLKPLDQQTPLQSQSYSALLDGLNPTQREAAAVINGPLLILAGAGSGKTRVLTYRIAYLIEKGVQPWNILALTFTNKAAGEMRERIATLVGEEKARRIWAGTFHSIFARILRREAEQIGFTPSFSIYDGDDSLSIIKQVMATLGISQQNYNPSAVRGAISSAKNKMLSWQEYSREAASLFEKQVGLVYKDYEKRLAKNNAMDFDDLLLNMIRLLRNHPGALERYHDQFRYILIDEYQDTNKAQYEVVNLLARKYRNVCVVGDDAQSIYRWRGADIRNILDFERDYADANVVRLEQNYRSTKTILEAANDVINRNSRQIKKALWTDNVGGDKIQLLR
ncbi:MAG: ATP-dependent helicase, partial [Candidatus Kapaibacteriota bacterium]